MLESYEAIIKNGQVEWLTGQPKAKSARIIVTVLEEYAPAKKRRVPPPSLAGKIEILGNIVSPIVNEEEWECPEGA